MKKRNCFMLAIVYCTVIFSVFGEEVDFPFWETFNEYRDLKSRAVALTGEKFTSEMKAYHGDRNIYRTFVNDSDPVIYVLNNEYVVESVEKETGVVESKMVNKPSRYWPFSIVETMGDVFFIKVTETIIGTIQDNELVRSDTRTISSFYDFLSTTTGPKVGAESPINNYYILEKDVPLLLERLKSETANTNKIGNNDALIREMSNNPNGIPYGIGVVSGNARAMTNEGYISALTQTPIWPIEQFDKNPFFEKVSTLMPTDIIVFIATNGREQKNHIVVWFGAYGPEKGIPDQIAESAPGVGVRYSTLKQLTDEYDKDGFTYTQTFYRLRK